MKIANNSTWLGAFPRANATKLGPNQATYASGFRLDSGALKPWKDTNLKTSVTKTGTMQSIYRWGAVPGDENSGYWFHWTQDVDVTPGPVKGDTEARTYFTGDGEPKYTFSGIATAGGTDYPNASRPLGVPEPTGTITVGVEGTADPDADVAVDVTETKYCIVWVTDKGEWGPPGAFSASVSLILGENAALSNIPTAPGGGVIVDHKRLYRLATGSSGTDYYYVAQLAPATTTYSDLVADADLGDVLESTDWYPPPSDMFGIGVTANGIAYGFSKNQICLGEPYLPHAWNPENQKVTSKDIIGGAHVRDMIFVFDHEKAYIVSGIEPRTMTVDEINNHQTCVSKRSIVSTPYGVVYASPDGMFLIRGPNDSVNLTQGYFNEKQWRAFKPETILGAIYENKYIGFYDDGATQGSFILDPANPTAGIMLLDVWATAAYRDPLTDKLYLVRNDNEIHEFNEGADLSGIWKSGTVILPTDRKMCVARVYVEGTITLRVYVNGSLVSDMSISDNKPVRFSMVRGRVIRYELEGTGTVSSVEICESMGELYG